MEKALRFPRPVVPGDTLGVVAPSFPVREEERARIPGLLEELGYHVRMGRTIRELMNFHGYLAGDARSRAQDINDMFLDDGIDGIICARGGLGSCQTMEFLDLEGIRKHPKVFIGYSDITNFHSVLNRYCDLVTFHGPMVLSNIAKSYDDYSRKSLRAALDMKDRYVFRNPPEIPYQVIVPGKAEGMITGGNMSLVVKSVGTFFQPETKGKILFLEDVEESIPHLDMYISQLEEAGVFDGVRGILLGNFKECDNHEYDAAFTVPDFLAVRFAGMHIPVMAGVWSGHEKPMGTIPMGTICHMDTASDEIVFTK